MKRVLLEMERLKNPYNGLWQVCLSLGEQFQKIEPQNLRLDFYLPDSHRGIFGERFGYVKHSALHKFFPLNSRAYNVWHCLHQDSQYFPADRKTKMILTIHDLNFLENDAARKRERRLKSLQKRVDRARAITVISEFTEKIVRQNLELNDKPVRVIYNGNSLKTFENPSAPRFADLSNFIFSISLITRKKNFHTLLPLLRNDARLSLVIAGNNDTDYARLIARQAENLGVAARLHLIGTVTDEEKFWLYQNCAAFVFPSLAEGFGLPVVEAMSVGKPVFLSDLTSLPEIGGREAYYWKNFEPQTMIEVFETGRRDFSEEKAARSITWANQFSWERAAAEYLKLYEEI